MRAFVRDCLRWGRVNVTEKYALLDKIPIGLFMINSGFEIVFWNLCFEDWLGIDRSDALGKDIRTVFPRLGEGRYQSRLDKLFEDGLPIVLSYQLNGDIFSAQAKDHDDRLHHCTITSMSGAGGPFALFSVEDRTEVSMRIRLARVELLMRYEVEKELRNALTEKEMLMKELNHRVKNNLNMVRSLISLQGDSVSGTLIGDIFQDLESRISSIALLHEMLYKTGIDNTISLDVYLESLCSTIFSSFLSGDTQIRLALDLSPMSVSTDITLHVGLIVSELLTNAIKYGIKGRPAGRVSVSLTSSEQGLLLVVADDGPGMSEGFDPDKVSSLGMKLVYMITDQLKGMLELLPPHTEGPKGCAFRLMIPTKSLKQEKSDP